MKILQGVAGKGFSAHLPSMQKCLVADYGYELRVVDMNSLTY
jgi:hypothetical protein